MAVSAKKGIHIFREVLEELEVQYWNSESSTKPLALRTDSIFRPFGRVAVQIEPAKHNTSGEHRTIRVESTKVVLNQSYTAFQFVTVKMML